MVITSHELVLTSTYQSFTIMTDQTQQRLKCYTETDHVELDLESQNRYYVLCKYSESSNFMCSCQHSSANLLFELHRMRFTKLWFLFRKEYES
jgi:hypothetical protein